MLSNLSNLEEALEFFWGQYPILMGDLNLELDDSQNPRSQLVDNILTEFFLIDLMHHFRQRRRFLYMNMLTYTQQATVLKSRCEYFFSTDCHIFKLVVIRDMRNYSSNHFALQVRLVTSHTCKR